MQEWLRVMEETMEQETLGSTEKKMLFLVRHAHAENGAPDKERPLSAAGIQRAAQLGNELAELDFDVVLASSATRVRQTLAAIEEAHSAAWPQPLIEDRFYNAETDVWLDALRSLPGHARTALIIGHNPAVSQLAGVLGSGPASMSPGACIRFAGEIDWNSLGQAPLRVG